MQQYQSWGMSSTLESPYPLGIAHCHSRMVQYLHGSRETRRGRGRASLRAEKLQPSAKLRSVRIPLRPSESLLVPLRSPRDTLPEGRTIHSLTLTYKLNVAEAGKHTPSIPLLNRHAPAAFPRTPAQ